MKKKVYLKEVNIMDNNEKRCSGCGILLQDENVLQEGYTTNLENNICQRCFRMKNYGEYQMITKSNEEYLNILKDVGETKDLVLYITDLLNLEKNIETIRTIIPNKMILVLNKKDVLPKSVKETKLINYLATKDIHFEEVIVISVNKNYNIDYLLKRICFMYGRTKVTALVRDYFEKDLAELEVYKDKDFLSLHPIVALPLRISKDRSIEHIHPLELMDAIYQIVKKSNGITKDGCFKHIVGLLGYSRMSERAIEILEEALVFLKLDGKIIEKQDCLYI